MKARSTLAGFAVAMLSVTAPVAFIAPAQAAHGHSAVVAKQHACTKTSSGTCIKGGQFCPQAKYGKNGWDAKGRRYVCKGNHTHPHWMKP
ncbi:hypothetical protein H5V45_07505 [Nocardioides sp. KIGAM211]|uniref:Uncharacterized protein n=1 Tax=Nocardioides luti TaxID=2761101 RepID=A0A7X0VAB7_9ACTN|nr:hypothetical protein [Nocardioides luti]MBB6627165.1 hypothetical protein [Nocardioides luti]